MSSVSHNPSQHRKNQEEKKERQSKMERMGAVEARAHQQSEIDKRKKEKVAKFTEQLEEIQMT
jgi:hypothetical protein